MSKYKDYLLYYKRKLERCINDETALNQVIEKLTKAEFPVADLLNTEIYRLVRGISKSGCENAEKSLPLYNKWKMQILEHNGAAKSGAIQSNIPAARVAEPVENPVSDSSRSFPGQPNEMRNGFTDIVQKNTSNYSGNAVNDKPHRNPSPIEEGNVKTKSSAPVQPHVNKFQPFSSFSSSFPAHNLKLGENSTEVKNVADLPENLDSHSNVSTSFSSPQSTSSQNPLDITATTTASPSKIGRIPDPYTIEMKEGMFRVVKSSEGLTPDIIRVRRMYNRDEDYCDSAIEDDKLEEMDTTPKKNEKSAKVTNEKGIEKPSTSKIKGHTPEKSNKHKSGAEKTFVKSEKIKSDSPKSKIAIERSERKVKEKNAEVPKSGKDFNLHKGASKSNIKGSPIIKSNVKGSPTIKSNGKTSPTYKASTKGSPSVKSSSRGSPSLKSSSKGSPSIKSSSKDNLLVKSSTKSSPSFFHNHANSSPCDIKKSNIGHKDCDKKSNKALTNDAAENFTSSKKDRTSVYSGRKTFQELPSLKSSCIRVLKKNIDSIKYTRQVPYEQLKPIFQNCSASQLRKIEEYNTYLLRDTDELWKSFCQRKYRDIKPVLHGTWRDLYWKTREDQEKKLKNITASISASMQKSAPERQVKLTLIESPERPRGKKMKTAVSEPKDGKITSRESFTHSNSSNAHKVPPKDSSHLKTPLKESLAPPHKKAKKAPVAPLMSKVKKTIGLLAMHKK